MSMSRTTVSFLLVCFFCVLFAGCGSEIRTYRHISETIQDYKFEQPSLKKAKVEQVRTLVNVEFDQEIETVNSDGSAIAKITFKKIRTLFKARDGVRFDFDSEREEDKKNSLYAMIGKSYTVNLLPDGGAKSVDTKEAIAAVTGAAEKRIAISLLKDRGIFRRHGVPGMPAGEQSLKNVGESWSKVVAGHEKLIPPKTFKKTYSVSKIEKKDGREIVIVKMNGIESDKPVEGLEGKSGMGFLEAMFDTKETYTGSMTFDSAARRAISYDEKLVAEYIATQEKIGAAKEENPDVLTMGLTYSINMELIK